ncbi:carbohydrate ABC transporter permease [Streptomyces aculeolatus]
MSTTTRPLPTPTAPVPLKRTPARRRRDRGSARRAITHVVLLVLGFAWIYPVIWAVAGSTRSNGEFLTTGIKPTMGDQATENYENAWNTGGFSQYFVNTVVVAVATVVLTVLFSAMAGYALSRTRFPGRKAILIGVAVTIFLPRGYTMIPVYDLVNDLGLLDSLAAIVAVQVGSGMIISTFLFMGFFRTVPRELEESARVDGAGFNQIFFRIVFPLASPMIATVALFQFIGSWNDFLIPLIFTLGQPDLRTIPVGLYAFVGQSSTDWAGLSAASVISMIPMLIVFAVAQKYIVAAIAGAVKG